MKEPLETADGDLDARNAIAVRYALLTALVMIAQQVAGKATRDALFLAQFDVRELPKIMVFSAALSVIGVLAMSTLLARFGPSRLMPRGFALSACLFVVEWWLLGQAPHAAIVMLYLHMGVVGVLLISGFWSVINERFDPHTAKRTIIRIAAAATLGGIIGGLIAGQFAAYAEPRQMLLVLAAMHGACVVGVRGIGTLGAPRRESPLPPIVAGITTLAGNRYLLQMALLMMLGAVVSGLLDYALKAETSLRFAEKPELLGFFATFYAVVGVITFAVQVALGPWLLNRFGLGGAIFILPAAVLFGATFAAAFDHFWAYVCLRALESIFANSLFRSGFEVLYMPLGPDEKRPTKTIIDVGGNRLGDMLSGGVLLALLALSPSIGSQWVVVAGAAVAGCSLWLMVHLYRGYVARLAGNLRSGWRPVEAEDLTDATTRRIFAETTAAAERELLLGRVRQFDGRSAANVADAIDERAVVLADLSSLQPERIRGALRSATLDVTMVPHLIPLLAQQEVADEVRTELRWLAPRVLGQLTDALLDPDVPLTARCRIPSVIEVVHSPRARDALLLGLEDSEFAVRYSCARTLARFTRRSRELRLPEDTVYALVTRELAVDDATWRCQTHVSGGGEAAVAAAEDDDVLVPSLQHVFMLLSLALDADAMQLALAGVASDEAGQRGTALEYLENVLPTEVREALWRRLGVTEPVERSQRSPKELLGDLLQPGRRRRP